MQAREYIRTLTELNRTSPDAERELELAERRIDFDLAAANSQQVSTSAWQAPQQSPFDQPAYRLPEIDVSQISLDSLACGIHFHGGIIVRGLFSQQKAADYRQQMDQAFASQEQHEKDSSTDCWFHPPKALLENRYCKVRGIVRQTGSMWMANSPRLMFNLLEEYQRMGLRPMFDQYFGEPSYLSVKKWLARRVEPLQRPSDWHQDGAFMGADVRSINMWIALSDCGADATAPGIDIVPGQLDHIVETGTEGAAFKWSVGDAVARRYITEGEMLCPRFNVGDALFFDHFNLHRTSWAEHYTQPRYALECWFLGGSNYPQNQVPLLW